MTGGRVNETLRERITAAITVHVCDNAEAMTLDGLWCWRFHIGEDRLHFALLPDFTCIAARQ